MLDNGYVMHPILFRRCRRQQLSCNNIRPSHEPMLRRIQMHYDLLKRGWNVQKTSRSKTAKIQEYRVQASGLLESLTSAFGLYESSKTMW